MDLSQYHIDLNRSNYKSKFNQLHNVKFITLFHICPPIFY